MNSLFRKVIAVVGLMPFSVIASAGNMGAGEVHAVFNGLEWQKGNGKLLVQFVKPDVVRVRFQPEGKFAGNGTDASNLQESSLMHLTLSRYILEQMPTLKSTRMPVMAIPTRRKPLPPIVCIGMTRLKPWKFQREREVTEIW